MHSQTIIQEAFQEIIHSQISRTLNGYLSNHTVIKQYKKHKFLQSLLVKPKLEEEPTRILGNNTDLTHSSWLTKTKVYATNTIICWQFSFNATHVVGKEHLDTRRVCHLKIITSNTQSDSFYSPTKKMVGFWRKVKILQTSLSGISSWKFQHSPRSC